jgi:hypothetical protein
MYNEPMNKTDEKSLAKWPQYIYILFGIATGICIGFLISAFIYEYVFYQYFAPAPSVNGGVFSFEYTGYGVEIILVCTAIFALIVSIIAGRLFRKNRNKALLAAPNEANEIQMTGLIYCILIAIIVSILSILAAVGIFGKYTFDQPPSNYCTNGYTSAYAKYECESSKAVQN